MNGAILKAFVLCKEIVDSPGGSGQKDLHGAGLSLIRASGPFPFKHSFWVYLEITDQKPTGSIQLALMRADSGRRHFFRDVTVEFSDPLTSTRVSIRLFDCVFPIPGVYFVELWYDGSWLSDQRFEVFGIEGD
jgi:hypothetical protein